MLIIQPLIQGLRGLGIYSRVYEDKEGILTVELGSKLNSFYEQKEVTGKFIFGNPLTKKEVTYKLYEDHFEKDCKFTSISEFIIASVDRLVDSCYHFEETHKVTEWKS